MYQRARKLAALIREPSNFLSLAELQLEAYVVGMNALELIDQRNAWIVMPVTAESEHEVCTVCPSVSDDIHSDGEL